MVYRLYRRDQIKAGLWYYKVDCGKCHKPIHLLDDKSGGTRPAQIVGSGIIAAPCRRCGHEGEYAASGMMSVRSDENIDATYPERPKPSKSSRKPLNRYAKGIKPTFAVGIIEDRPRAASAIARIVTSWTDIEVQCTRLLAELMDTNARPAAAVFGSLRSSRAQYDALSAAAGVVLNDADKDLFEAYMARRSSLEKERNDLAHGCFGVSVAIPDAVIWVSQADFLAFNAAKEHDPSALETFRSKQAVYELGTLERIAQEIAEFHTQLCFFTGYLSARHSQLNGAAFRAERYPQLCSQAHIREALDRIQTAKKASQSHDPKKPSIRKPKR